MAKFLTHTALALTLLTSASLATTASAAEMSAQEKPFYVTFNGGQLDFDIVGGKVDSNTYTLGFGWQPIPYISTEFSYSYLDIEDDVAVDLEGHHIEAFIVATPLKYRIRPILMIGLTHGRYDYDLTSIGQSLLPNISASDSENQTEFLFGVGFDFDITETIGVRGVYKKILGDIDADGWFLGPIVRF